MIWVSIMDPSGDSPRSVVGRSFEPEASALQGRRSSQLSYGPSVIMKRQRHSLDAKDSNKNVFFL